MNLNHNLRATGKKLRLVPVAVALFGFAAMNSGTAFATSASISPSSTTACYQLTVNFGLSWSGNAPYDWDFNSDDSYGDMITTEE